MKKLAALLVSGLLSLGFASTQAASMDYGLSCSAIDLGQVQGFSWDLRPYTLPLPSMHGFEDAGFEAMPANATDSAAESLLFVEFVRAAPQEGIWYFQVWGMVSC